MAQKQQISDFSIADLQGDLGMFLEKRMAYNGDDLEYVGYNREPNAATTEATWLVVKMTYAAAAVTRYQLPDNGPQFKYTWDDRAAAFS